MNMQHEARWGSELAQRSYPLSVPDCANWRQSGAQLWTWETSLPPIPKDHILVPSFSCLDHPYKFQFDLQTDFLLHPVPAQADDKPASPPAKNISCHIDCWHTASALDATQLRLCVQSPLKPKDYLICVTVRPLEITPQTPSPDTDVSANCPQPISQMQAKKSIRHGICSPTALSMAIERSGAAWKDTISACFDPITRAYGSWPLAIHWASQQSVLGAVEVNSDWRSALAMLRAKQAIVCSIRFRENQLAGAPLAQTGGHLVLLHAASGDFAKVLDPAAGSKSKVARSYAIDEFTRAWLQHRGAAYFFALN